MDDKTPSDIADLGSFEYDPQGNTWWSHELLPQGTFRFRVVFDVTHHQHFVTADPSSPVPRRDYRPEVLPAEPDATMRRMFEEYRERHAALEPVYVAGLLKAFRSTSTTDPTWLRDVYGIDPELSDAEVLQLVEGAEVAISKTIYPWGTEYATRTFFHVRWDEEHGVPFAIRDGEAIILGD